MFGRAVWDKLPECIFENFEVLKITSVIYPKNCPTQIYGYWLITQNQQTVGIKTVF